MQNKNIFITRVCKKKHQLVFHEQNILMSVLGKKVSLKNKSLNEYLV